MMAIRYELLPHGIRVISSYSICWIDADDLVEFKDALERGIAAYYETVFAHIEAKEAGSK